VTARDDFLDALRSTASARESITCYADGIVLHQREGGGCTYGDGNLGDVGYTG
jgi:hypothetical protein